MKNKVDKEYIDKATTSIKDEDIKKAAENTEKINEKIKGSKTLNKFFDDLSLLGALIKDYWKGNYRNIPYKAITVIAFTLLYVLNVADIVPDIIPGFGLLDDASVVAFCLKVVGDELLKYKLWKDEN